ncbi:phenoloxidase-activating factor 2-like, partial [Amphibalanus amphitrite]|uniref:phenoloxidase-activating factor 2-like n=1 Tax=Amphibalanus amphitrite TaxID=1232801 RepID=UPI001C910676
MRLVGSIQFDAHVQPICLPEQDQRFEGARCIISGWGKPAFVGNYSERMERVEVPVVNRDVCVQNLRDTHLGHFFRLDDSMLCAGGEEDADACRGDAGGPLVCLLTPYPLSHRGDAGGPLACRSADGSYVLAGVAAWSVGCSRHGVPSVYT